LGDRGEPVFIERAFAQRNERDQPVKRAALEIVEAQLARHAARDGALARGGRTVDRDHRHAHAAIFPNCAKKSGKVFATHCGSLMRTGTPPSETSAKLIAMR